MLADVSSVSYVPPLPGQPLGHLLFIRNSTLMAQPFDLKLFEPTGDAFPVAEKVSFGANLNFAPVTASANGVLVYQENRTVLGGEIVWLDRAGKPAGQIAPAALYVDVSLSPDQKYAAYSRYAADSNFTDLWLNEFARSTGVRFTSHRSFNNGAVWSPRGDRIVFSSTRDNGVPNFFTKAVNGAGQDEPLFSNGHQKVPDSRSLGFFAGGKMKRIDVSGGPALTLCDAVQPRGGAWGSRGVVVFNPGNNVPLMRVPAGGGTPTPATQLDSATGETTHRWPSFLPDGRHFLYLARATDREKSAIWVGDLESKTRHRVASGVSNAAYDPRGFVLFMRDTTLIAQPFDARRLETTGEAFPVAEQVDFTFNNSLGHFSISQTGTLVFYSGGTSNNENLTWLDRTGKPLGTVGPPGNMLQPAISPDGAMVAVERVEPQTGTESARQCSTISGCTISLTPLTPVSPSTPGMMGTLPGRPTAAAFCSDYLARFTREAQVLASLNHPNIAN